MSFVSFYNRAIWNFCLVVCQRNMSQSAITKSKYFKCFSSDLVMQALFRIC